MSKDTTHTNGVVSEEYKKMMEYTGFYRGGRPTAGIIEAATLRENSNGLLDKRIKYNAVIDSTKLNADAIFELSGSPCIYFTNLSQAEPDPSELAALRKTAWNQGLAPMLWVITPTKVLLYNCYARPAPDDEKYPERHLIELFELTENSLRQLNDFAGRLQLESGRFWQHEKARQIDRRQRVDAALLADLEEAERLLVKAGLEPAVAHALLGRSIFVAYLHDRGILGSNFFRERFNVENFVELLSSEFAKSATYEVFEWVRKTFNGDLFPLEHEDKQGHIMQEQDLVNITHLGKVGDLLAGVEMKTGQGRLWPYKFDVIPIELISSIYEMFIHSSNSQIAKEHSTYYTPINLVDLVLSEVFKHLPADAKVLDISCGSGVFLVESLRRLVACRVANGEEWSRELVRDTLYNQIYGVDISKEAMQIAAFSLYLTALELDPDLQSLDKIQFQNLSEKNLFDSDAFDESAPFNKREPFVSKKFQAIVGNPPWKRTQADYLAEKYCNSRGYPLTRRSLDQAFLWRIADFANEKTLIGLILHSRPLFGHMPDSLKARERLLTRFNPQVIVNLSALRQDGLFPKSDAPATVLIAEGRYSEINGCFYFVNVERSESFKRHGIIEIGPENIKKISIRHVISDTDVLKIASWGSARDMALITRLRATFPSLGSLVNDKKLVNKKKKDGWMGGQGFQEAGGSQEAPKLIGKKWLPSGEMQSYLIDISGLEEISPERRFHRPRDSRIYEGPLVVTTRGLGVDGFFSAFSSDDVVYTEEYYGISVPRQQEHLAHYLNGIFNSSLANYFLFLTASVWGVERDKVEPNDLLRLPLPIPTEDNEHIISRIVRLEEQLRFLQDKPTRAKVKGQLDRAVFDLYDLSDVERILVEDTLSFTIDLRMKGEASEVLHRPENVELEGYSTQLINTIQPFFRTLNEVMMVADIFETKTAPLQVIKFSVVPVSEHILPTQVVAGQILDDVLRRIAIQLPTRVADTIYTRRNLRIYIGSDFYIVKPSQRRYWSRYAALNDADTIISEQMKGNYASIR
jgi:type I restriction-modification system DNA methylase subunit